MTSQATQTARDRAAAGDNFRLPASLESRLPKDALARRVLALLLLLGAEVLAAGVLFLTNTLRISALILIGNAGAPQIAVGGFHSQAGWITFCLVSIGMVIVSRRLAWVSAHPRRPGGGAGGMAVLRIPEDRAIENPVAPFLVPFLAILAAGVAYGLVAAWRGRIGDAAVAHATSNCLLAVYVLAFGQWQLW